VTTTAPTIETVRALAAKYNAWGRWGPDDQLGTLNNVTPERIKASAQLVRKGKVFSLALPLDQTGPQTGSFGRYNPLHHMIWDGGDIAAGAQDHIAEVRYTDDAAYIILQCSTQWDALAHIFHDGKMYGGHGTELVTSRGAQRNAMTNAKDRMVGRGVLLDVPRHLGKPWLDVDHAIQADEMAACAEAQGVEVGEGDFVLVRTGQIAMCRDAGSWGDYAGGPAPGFGVSVADYFCPKGPAAVITDTWGTEKLPNETPDCFQPLHIIMIVNAGIHLGEMWDLEELADDCAEDGVYEFQLIAPPLTITGSVGSPVNPQAIK
jgi:kynurenine formamidase